MVNGKGTPGQVMLMTRGHDKSVPPLQDGLLMQGGTGVIVPAARSRGTFFFEWGLIHRE